MRRHPPPGIAKRRAVAEAYQREELIELALAINGQRLSTQIAERQDLLLDDWRENDAHDSILRYPAAPRERYDALRITRLPDSVTA